MDHPLSRLLRSPRLQVLLVVGMLAITGCTSTDQEGRVSRNDGLQSLPAHRATGIHGRRWHARSDMFRAGVPVSRSRIGALWDPAAETWNVSARTLLAAERCEAEAVLDADMNLISYRMSADSERTGAPIWNVSCTRYAGVLWFINQTADGSVNVVPVRSQQQVYPSTLTSFVLSARSTGFPHQDRFMAQIVYEKTLEIIPVEYSRTELRYGDRTIIQFCGELRGMEVLEYFDQSADLLGSRIGDLMLVSRTGQQMGFDPPSRRARRTDHEHVPGPSRPIPPGNDLGYSDVRLVGDLPVQPVTDDRQLLLLGPAKEGAKWRTEVRVLETSAWPGVGPSSVDMRATAHVQSVADGIRQQAMTITRDTDGALSSAMRLLEWCHRSLRYSDGAAVDANSVFRSRIAECQGASNLLVAMCRSIGIPSRPVAGVMLPTAVGERAVPQFHQWAEIYDGRVWHGLDPVPGSLVTSRHLKLVEIQDPSDLWTIYPHLDTLSVEVTRSE